MSLEEIKGKTAAILERYPIRKAAIFGSFARGNNRNDSDLDILVEADDSLSLLDFVGIKGDLEDVLGRKVDLVEYDTIKPRIRESVLANTVQLL